MLLDTCNNRLSDGRYDIIVHSPAAKYQFKNACASLEDPQHLFSGASLVHRPFEDLAILHRLFQKGFELPRSNSSEHNSSLPIDIDSLPFLAGAMGLFGYDINIFTDGIKDNNAQQYHLDDIAVGFYTHSLIIDTYTNQVFYVCPEKSMSGPHGSTNCQWLQALLEPAPSENFALIGEWTSNMNEAQYTESMNKIDEYLHSGDCYQINFAQRFSAPYHGDEWLAYKKLTEVNKAPFSAFIRLPKSCVLSVSPERFLSVKNGEVVTKPIKGTRKRASDKQEDEMLANELLSSEKDKAENLMIVDLLRNDLSKHCEVNSVSVPKLFALESYPAVHHMVSTVVGKLKANASPFDLLAGAFPGGSITGAPKVRAMQIIQELEPDKRSIYCGSIGYLGIRDDMDTSICIRTILAEDGVLHCWAGGGIVLDSTAHDEYQESFHKVAKILPTLSETIKEMNEGV
ncbi:aminodeoxychorismate synthase component I [Ningiella sp. W23]|uniref:aminodeoxychorismate synthase component I n=1 Tax=Ningiella sp. W23 TaxID=3023715 RepID=UPI0037562FDE